MKYLFYTVSSILIAAFGNSIVAQITVLEENFDAGIPSSFVIVNKDEHTPHADVAEYTDAWISKQDPTDPTNTVASATSYFEPTGMADRWLITPSLSLGAFGNFLSWTGKSQDASFSESYLVLVSTTDTDPESFTDTVGVVLNEDIYWTNHSVDLSEEGFNNQTIHVAFVLRSINGFKFYMDSVKIVREDPVSIEEKAPIAEFKLYPNPATEVISFQAEFPVQQVIVRSMNGTIVLQTEENTIDVRNLSNGIYFLELIHSEGVSSKRFIKH